MSPSNGKPEAPDPHKLRVLFALLYSSPEPVSQDRIRAVLHPEAVLGDAVEEGAEAEATPATDEEPFSPREYLFALQEWIKARELPLELHNVGKAWRLLTSSDVAAELEVVRKQVHKERLGPAGLEVLSLVAYRQPVLKADIDAIRGVKSGTHLRHLLDLRLVRILGRADLPGRPFLYGTTREFLDRFGLRDLKDLPQSERLAVPAEAPPKPTAEAEQADSAESGDAADGGHDEPPDSSTAQESASKDPASASE